MNLIKIEFILCGFVCKHRGILSPVIIEPLDHFAFTPEEFDIRDLLEFWDSAFHTQSFINI